MKEDWLCGGDAETDCQCLNGVSLCLAGKPENQNHAIIFTRGEHVQAIDMNQEGYFEDAFKVGALACHCTRPGERAPVMGQTSLAGTRRD